MIKSEYYSLQFIFFMYDLMASLCLSLLKFLLLILDLTFLTYKLNNGSAL